MPMLLEGKKILVTGVLTRASIAFAIADLAQREGAEVILTSFGRVRTITEMSAKRLKPVPDILELDVNRREDIDAVAADLEKRWGRLDGIVHAIGYAPADALSGNFLNTPWESVATAFRTSAFSLKELSVGLLPLMKEKGGSIVTLDFDNSTQAWPAYDWMGVSKAALEAICRYLARDLGKYQIRVNAICAGPVSTIAAKGIEGFKAIESTWDKRAPLGWNSKSADAIARTACALLSDFMPATTAELIHVDGGYHAMGAETPES
jgi:enoyl-[acyl-carrier protein] reductase I